ncbi:hypothetical protein N7499_009599 [Penicillium canescens]|uniref:Uncharacterized protein n=1 Tax=Penicillium canescens TaxID=5083 RepID=A0AAD6IN79_PENCN|nr:uncharacterized protein N7446_008382 [Penicillium canescens]KAJ6019242.1 hypothetical protein N7522_001309 [Penicillium canescens]KAJ6033328.1 hypothetical protein N7444_011099 [Penicillium canescens]KAJ6057481.1 hypothetical protein N7460_000755 [Penicillium canescens]KAJ6058799.1 hypothetical protein N7446_008382 [Penicillium canescens]KAJ6071585.1 hypothetical protein N7499_009599 [Penicillium canescens]
MQKPALFTSTSIVVPDTVSLARSAAGVDGSFTSRACHSLLMEAISDTSSGVRDGLRDVSITFWLADWVARARERLMPEDVPFISQVRVGLVW